MGRTPHRKLLGGSANWRLPHVSVILDSRPSTSEIQDYLRFRMTAPGRERLGPYCIRETKPLPRELVFPESQLRN